MMIIDIDNLLLLCKLLAKLFQHILICLSVQYFRVHQEAIKVEYYMGNLNFEMHYCSVEVDIIKIMVFFRKSAG
jgi:hypothetical protein